MPSAPSPARCASSASTGSRVADRHRPERHVETATVPSPPVTVTRQRRRWSTAASPSLRPANRFTQPTSRSGGDLDGDGAAGHRAALGHRARTALRHSPTRRPTVARSSPARVRADAAARSSVSEAT